jgi:hypothetical protein
MSHSQQPRLPLGATPGKLALIVVLAVVMVAVIASNWPSAAAPPMDETETAAEPQTPTPDASSSATTETQPAASASPFGKFAEDRHWPEPPLNEVTEFDPLAASDWARPPSAALDGGPVYNEQQINELLAKNAIIFVAGDKRIARIGDQEFQVGDVIGRYTISDISAKGVVLSEAK